MSKRLQIYCTEDLKQLLAAWKLENILSHLVAEEVTIEVLKVIKRSHIKPLLSKFSFGTQILFEHCLEQWRVKIGKPLKQNPHEDMKPNKNDKSEHKDILTKSCNGTNKEASNQDESETNAGIDIKEILSKCCPEGPELLKAYHKNQSFSAPERSHLINIIVNYFLEHNLPFNLYTSFELENAIMSLFPNEKLELFRCEKQSKIYTKYLAAKNVYSKQKSSDLQEVAREEEMKISKTEGNCNRNKHNQLLESQQIHSLLIEADNYEENTTANETPTEILLQALYRGCRRFIKIFDPFLYDDFLSAVCTLFNVANKCDLYVAVNDCEILADDFKNVILQYYKLPTFTVELKEKVLPFIVTKSEDFEISNLETCLPAQTIPYTPVKLYEEKIPHKNSSMQIINNYLPDANDIRKIPALFPIVKMSDDGKRLENKHRATIAKALIDECLNYQPERVLKRKEFFTLTQNLVKAFPREVESTYFIPAQPNVHARGKLWNAYNNKRKMLASSGVLDRRHHGNMKRLRQSDDESDRTTYDKVFVTDHASESNDFCFNSMLDWDTIKQKWADTHPKRRDKLLSNKLAPQDYMEKYSILKSNRGIELMEIDVNMLYPAALDINNWLSLYQKIVDRVRTLRKEPIPKILNWIDNSNDETYRASIALLIIPYIFPYNAKRSENATKIDIQKRFVKEYTSLADLESDTECADLQLRFVHDEQQINYAEFYVCGQIFKCCDLWQALNSIFHYIIALNLEYPRMCLYVWQFIQLAIFQIEIKEGLQPNVEIILNDLCLY